MNQNLTYAYLSDWIKAKRAEEKAGKAGAEHRLAAALALHEPKSIFKDKDRGKESERDKDDYPWFWKGTEFIGDRVNDVHLTNAEKQAARDRKGG
jgi:hypothetical protein